MHKIQGVNCELLLRVEMRMVASTSGGIDDTKEEECYTMGFQ